MAVPPTLRNTLLTLLGVSLDMCQAHNYIMIDTSAPDFIYNGHSNMAQYGQNILTNVYNHKLYRWGGDYLNS